MSEPVIAGEYTLNIDVPEEIKELKVLRDLELEEEGKGKLRSLANLNQIGWEHDDRIHLSFACNIQSTSAV